MYEAWTTDILEAIEEYEEYKANEEEQAKAYSFLMPKHML